MQSSGVSENTATQLAPPVQTTKNTRYTQKSSVPHPTDLKKFVKQLSLSVTQTSPHPYNIQHINKDPQRNPYAPPTHIPQYPRPTIHDTIGKDVAMRHNINQEKRKPSSNIKELTAPKKTKSTAYTSHSTTSPETCNPKQNTPLSSTITLESQPSPQPRPPQCPPPPLSPTTSGPLTTRHHPITHHTDTANAQDSTPCNIHPNT